MALIKQIDRCRVHWKWCEISDLPLHLAHRENNYENSLLLDYEQEFKILFDLCELLHIPFPPYYYFKVQFF